MANFRLPGPIGLNQKPIEAFSTAHRSEIGNRRRNQGPSLSVHLSNAGHRETFVNFDPSSHVTVFVWVSHIKSKSPGHAASALQPGAETPQAGYVSFAPLTEGDMDGPGKFYPKSHDIKHYGTVSQTSNERRGVWIANLYGLNITQMMKRLENDLSSVPNYSVPKNQCATTVHRYLQIGGADPLASWWSSHVVGGIWSPDDIEDYAKSIAENTKNLGSNYKKYSGVGTVWGGSKETQ